MKTKKRYNTPKLTPAERQQIEAAVLTLAISHVEPAYFVVAVEMEEEFGRWFLRVYIDKCDEAYAMTVADCAKISHLLDPLIETQVKALENFPYNLELSSPGLFREVKTMRELTYYINRRITFKKKGDKNSTLALLSAIQPETNTLTFQLLDEKEALIEVQAHDWNPKQLQITLAPRLKSVTQQDAATVINLENESPQALGKGEHHHD
jgi:ribosome maturation factor RimP